MNKVILAITGLCMLLAGSGDIALEMETEMSVETETQTESETKKSIHIIAVEVDYPDGKREFDDTKEVQLRVKTEQIGEGDVWVEAKGAAKESRVGRWEVIPRYEVKGIDAEAFLLEAEEHVLFVEITPKVLDIEIAGAVKEYYTDVNVTNLTFRTKAHLSVTGFMKAGERTTELPEGFKLPVITIDESVLQKESFLYDKSGNRMVYPDALIIKTTKQGALTGNTTENYCYQIEEPKHYKKGEVQLIPSKDAAGYELQLESGQWWQGAEVLWLSAGSTLLIIPAVESGYNQSVVTEPLVASGTYSFRLQYVDKQGHIRAESNVQSLPFAIDGKAPDGTFLMNGSKQFKEYNNQDVILEVTATDQETGIAEIQYCIVAAGKGRSDPEDNWLELETTQGGIRWGEEGTWQVGLKLFDMVGNETLLFSQPFTIDKTPPKITMKGVKADSTNRGNLDLEVVCEDSYLVRKTLKVELRGERNGILPISYRDKVDSNRIGRTFQKIKEAQEYDDHYTLYAEICDKAGNRAEQTIHFTRNRFGSDFFVSEDTKSMTDLFYTNEEFTVAIYERNLDELKQSSVVCSHDGELEMLQQGADYTVKKEKREDGYYEYQYEIQKEHFVEEGHYIISVYSEDQAGNKSDSSIVGLPLSFIIDKTPPWCIVTGIEATAEYYEAERTAKISAGENYELKCLQIYQNGELVKETDKMEILHTIKSSSQWQTLLVYAKDMAGNEYYSEEIPVWVGTAAASKSKKKARLVEETELHSERESIKVQAEIRQYPGYIYGLVLAAAGILVTGVGAAVIIKRKK